ncbi:MAG: DEAD/DEAH box helicase family protein [Myxococcota bacterium]|nr:DEAD/DEAH box helicase family protein [Myxococcota bacterium]
MELKRFQERVVREIDAYLRALADEQAAGNVRHAAADAWAKANVLRAYRERKNGIGEDLPTFCIKVPTGGGKTLLAAHVLGLIHRTILRDRHGAGLVLWVVPSDQIYRDTVGALRNPRHPYPETLEYGVGRRVEVWEKHEVARITPARLADRLNVLVVQLASVNRVTREQLKFFADCGGNIVQHFPPEDEPDRHADLLRRIPNLDKLDDALVKTSLANLVRLCRPAVVLDEGHKATSRLARETIEKMNPSIVVELSATPPKDANVLVRVTGKELLDEEMIKLPINVACSNVASWTECLQQAADRRKELDALAADHYRTTGRTIRPIVLVQVERTGKDQRATQYVHSEDVREHLMQRLGAPATSIAVKSAETDDIEGIDLLAEGCPIEWIITKAALQEGWDCPFAYVLVSLNPGRSGVAMTQLVGRILRQPHARRTGTDALDESYVYCLRRSAADVVREVKAALEKEGYEGEAASVVDQTTDDGARPVERRRARIQERFRRHYLAPFEGRIFLPRFCVRLADDDYEALDYFRHLVARVDVGAFDCSQVERWDLAAEAAGAKTTHYVVNLEVEPTRLADAAAVAIETDDDVRAWLAANLAFDHLSTKQTRAVVDRAFDRLLRAQSGLDGRLPLVKHLLKEKLAGFIEAEMDRATEAAFVELHAGGALCFYLECVECRFEIPPAIDIRSLRQMNREDGTQLQRSLFEAVPDEMNEYERDVALWLDREPQVLWWYRNLVGREHFSIQGYRRHRVYPDFVVQEGTAEATPVARVLVVESKGKHLKGAADTDYKRRVAEYFNKVGREVTWQELAGGFADRRFRFQILDEGDYRGSDWQNTLRELLGAG